MANERKTFSGFTWRSVLIVIIAVFVFTPVSIWMNLTIGTGYQLYFTYTILLMAVEFTRISGNSLTKQEMATVFVALGGLSWGYALSIIQNAYFSQSEVLASFGLLGRIPYWVAPLPESGFYEMRSFIHPYYMPSMLGILGVLIPSAGSLAGLSLGILNKILYVDEEKLPYPSAQLTADLCTSLSEREPRRMHVFSLAFLFSFLYAVFLYTMPAAMGRYTIGIPLLWVDLSQGISRFLPGAAFGIATDFTTITPAFYLPLHVIVALVVGSISIWVFGNSIIVSQKLTEYAVKYTPGMSIYDIYRWSYQYNWMMPLIGLSIFVALTTLRPSILRGLISSLRRTAKRGAGMERLFSVWIIIIPLAAVALSQVINIWYRAPDYPLFPWYPLLMAFVFSFISSLLAGRSLGVGVGASIPTQELDALVLAGTNYQGISGWFVGWSGAVVGPNFGGPVDQNFKLSQLTESSFADFLKLYFIVYPLSIIASLFYTQMYWNMATIPSLTFPNTIFSWPVAVQSRAIWVTQPEGVFRPDWILYTIILGFAIYLPLSRLHKHAANIFMGFLAGMTLLPPFTVNYVIGYIIKLVIVRLVGVETFEKYKWTMVAAITAGTGLAIAIGVSLYIVQNSIWSRTY